jgi:hypothetical protein
VGFERTSDLAGNAAVALICELRHGIGQARLDTSMDCDFAFAVYIVHGKEVSDGGGRPNRGLCFRAVLVSAQKATETWDCRVEGCDGTALRNMGRHARLCQYHIDELERKRRLAKQNGASELNSEPQADHAEGVDQSRPDDVTENGDPTHKRSYEFRAAGLVDLGKRLDEAQRAFNEESAKLEQAQERWNAALAALANADSDRSGDVVA